MEGYWQKPEKTEDAMYNGYILTGDVGRMTRDGYLYFLGRRKNMIKSSGHSVSPAEVEQILKSHDDVENAAVIGQEHESRGEIVVAFLTTLSDELTEEEIIEWSADQMAEYKQPKKVEILDALPKTNVGKLDRQQLHEMV
jgi:long-chain acyl-CoA synthetase